MHKFKFSVDLEKESLQDLQNYILYQENVKLTIYNVEQNIKDYLTMIINSKKHEIKDKQKAISLLKFLEKQAIKL